MKATPVLMLSAFLLGGCAGSKKLVNVPTPPDPPAVEPTDPTREELRLEEGEYFPGQTSLTGRVVKDNLSGTLAVIDICPDDDGCTGDWHAKTVRDVAVAAGVPESRITMQGDTLLQIDGVSNVPEGTRVAVLSIFPAYGKGDGLFLANHGSLIAVAAAGNVEDDYNGDRDVYSNPNHPAWTDRCIPSCGTDEYYTTMDALRNANGKALLATVVIISEDGTAEPAEWVVMCGDAKDWCFAVEDTPLYTFGDGTLPPTTSFAAPILGAHAFYLSQLWDTADEVFSVLKECAVDIGEPGVDPEFGLGVPSAVCGTIQTREVQAASGSLSVGGQSVAVSALLAEGGSSVTMGSSLRAGPTFSVSPSGRSPDLLVSHSSVAAGKTVRGERTSFTALAGMGRSPLGVSSSLVRPDWSLFAETGVRRQVVAWEHASLSLLGAVGVNAGSVRTAAVRAGVAWQRRSLSLYAGHVLAGAFVPIPGHGAVDRPPTAAHGSGWEVSVSRAFSLGR